MNTKKDNDIICDVIRLHCEDTLFGNGRHELNYVDCIYPYIEKIFGLTICLLSINDPEILKNYYDENFHAIFTYSDLLNFFGDVKKSCDALNNKDSIINISENPDLNIVINDICNSKIEATDVKKM